MLRLAGFFLLAVVLATVLGKLPVIGPVFDHTGIFGILIASLLISAAFTWWGDRLLTTRKLKNEMRALEAVGNAHNHGKLGALLLVRGRERAAIAHLEEAVRGEPEVAEWHYRLGMARLATGAPAAALPELERCLALEEEHAYGAAQMRRVECLQRLARPEHALEALALFERNHGPSPEGAYRRARALRSLGRKDEARASLNEVGKLARHATRYQRKSAGMWALRASLARLF